MLRFSVPLPESPPVPPVPLSASTRLLGVALVLLFLAGCHSGENNRQATEAPPSTPAVVPVGGTQLVHVDRPADFPEVAATTRQIFSTLDATGSVQPDPSRELPVLSIANGRVLALHVGLGDYVHKGQLVMDVQSPDVTQAFGSYLKAVSDEHLTKVVLDRDNLLYSKGAIAKSQVEIAQNAEEDARAALTAAEQQLTILGVDKNHPSTTVHVYAPVSGFVVTQNTTAAGAAGITFAGPTGSLTIADVSHVWVVCDVYENDLANVHLGEQAQIRLNAFPGKILSGTISDIGAILDPAIRTAKVRIQVANPGDLLRIGMFATATFRSSTSTAATAVPADAVLHLHDSEFVFQPTNSSGDFRRVQVKAGRILDNNFVQILAGLTPGQQVVANALELQNTAAQ